MTPVFILSTNRCGSNWLARTLTRHPQTDVTIECDPVMSWVYTAALHPPMEPDYIPRIMDFYRKKIDECERPVYIDKSHFNLWLADALFDNFPNCKFIILNRPPMQTVASMLNHRGTLMLFVMAQTIEFPNRVLANMLFDEYKSLSYEEKAVLMYRQYKRKIYEVAAKYPERTLTVYYDAFVKCFDDYCKLICYFLDIDSIRFPNDADISCLNKYTGSLTPEQRKTCINLLSRRL